MLIVIGWFFGCTDCLTLTIPCSSYVNLSLFSDGQDREEIATLVGKDAEELTYQFCAINRQSLIFDLCMPLTTTTTPSIPEAGFVMEDLKKKDGTKIHLKRETVLQMVVLTIADFAEQYFGWQDGLFGRKEGVFQGVGDDIDSAFLWPGTCKPGVFLYFLSALATLLRGTNYQVDAIFDRCSTTISREIEEDARNLYWEVVSNEEIDNGSKLGKVCFFFFLSTF